MRLGVWFVLLFSSSFALAEVVHKYPDAEVLASEMTLIDIRTPGEWRQTGVVAGALPIMFFDERGRYDARAFLQAIEPHVSRDEPFAVICRTGNRTRAVSQFLSDQGYQVVNLKGGIHYLLNEGYQPVAFAEREQELQEEGLCDLEALAC